MPRPWLGPSRVLRCSCALRGFERLLIADIDPGRSVRCLGAVLGPVHLAQPQRVDLELARQLVHAAFDRERADRRARCAVGGNFGPVAQNVVADRFGVRQVVDREPANAALLDRRALECARLVFEHGLRGGDMAVLLGAELDFDDGARGRSGRPEYLFAAHHDLDRPARFLRQHIGDRLEIDDRLAAKAAADLGRDRADIGDVGADDARGVAAHHELALARAPDRGLAVGCDRNHAGMRLDIALVHRLGRVAPLDDDFGFAEPGLDIALGEAHHLRNVGGLGRLGVDARGEDVVMQQRRVRRHRRLDIHDVRQYLVFDLDQIKRLIGDRRGDGGDRGHRMPLVERLPDRHAVA